jgi:hypothetical protein
VAQVKGTAVQSSLRYVQERFGDAPLAGVLAALPEADRLALGQVVLASSWYPMDTFLRFMREAQRQLGEKEPDVVRKMGRASRDYGLTTVYRILEGGAPQVCERIFGWRQRTLELAGANNLRSAHSTCVHRGDGDCRFEGSWD